MPFSDDKEDIQYSILIQTLPLSKTIWIRFFWKCANFILYSIKTWNCCGIEDVIVFLQFPGLRNLQKPDSFFAILVARQDRTSEAPSFRCGTVLKVFASSQMPTSASVRPRCLCLCVNQTVVARFGATTCHQGGDWPLGHWPPESTRWARPTLCPSDSTSRKSAIICTFLLPSNW